MGCHLIKHHLYYTCRFRCLLTTMQQVPKNVITIVAAATVLHNYILDQNPIVSIAAADREEQDTHDVIPGAWRDVVDMTPLARLRRNTSLKVAKKQKAAMMAYYNSPVGSVPWQEKVVFGKHIFNAHLKKMKCIHYVVLNNKLNNF